MEGKEAGGDGSGGGGNLELDLLTPVVVQSHEGFVLRGGRRIDRLGRECATVTVWVLPSQFRGSPPATCRQTPTIATVVCSPHADLEIAVRSDRTSSNAFESTSRSVSPGDPARRCLLRRHPTIPPPHPLLPLPFGWTGTPCDKQLLRPTVAVDINRGTSIRLITNSRFPCFTVQTSMLMENQ